MGCKGPHIPLTACHISKSWSEFAHDAWLALLLDFVIPCFLFVCVCVCVVGEGLVINGVERPANW